ncbi:hypothetical protein VKT23_017284 [Stygiomarasmius scandens]|uniref:Uncharacterized protein n=1 Tax=Marasmiellus scandens TaxID=2682957 RepID=A0ABR1IUZ3_9AGAR
MATLQLNLIHDSYPDYIYQTLIFAPWTQPGLAFLHILVNSSPTEVWNVNTEPLPFSVSDFKYEMIHNAIATILSWTSPEEMAQNKHTFLAGFDIERLHLKAGSVLLRGKM